MQQLSIKPLLKNCKFRLKYIFTTIYLKTVNSEIDYETFPVVY